MFPDIFVESLLEIFYKTEKNTATKLQKNQNLIIPLSETVRFLERKFFLQLFVNEEKNLVKVFIHSENGQNTGEYFIFQKLEHNWQVVEQKSVCIWQHYHNLLKN